MRLARSRNSRLALTAALGAVALVIAVVASRRLAEIPWPLSRGNPGLLVAAAVLSLLGYTFKAYGWRQLVATHERPQALALAAANGGASITALALPGRFDDLVRIAIVRRFGGCPAGVRTLCLSLVMLGLIDSAALAPLALTAAVLPGHSIVVRLGLVLVAGVGFAAAAVVLALPRLAGSRRLLRFRLGRWLRPRTTSLREASQAWALVSACWLTRAVGLLLLLGALGIGFSFTLALLFLCATSVAAALPVGPGGTATQAGAGAAVLIASGVGISEAVGVAVAVQGMGILVGGSIFLFAAAWRAGLHVTLRYQPAAVRAVQVGIAGGVRP
ncbi:MAG TPA: lysylphosphatidylglycerol synthase domain-containing protein [Gaiellaceae bacterium]|nr:lysylphosphatidylglycerol synthase domain-containing protein [Gaiellaceae bacterium]